MPSLLDVSWILSGIGFPFAIFCSMTRFFKRDITPMKKRAKEQNRFYKLAAQAQFRPDSWYQATYNTWAVFGRTYEDTIVVFDYAGKARYELCEPNDFQTFLVDEDKLILVDQEGEKTDYPFRSIGLEFDPAKTEKRIVSVSVSNGKLLVAFDGKRTPKVFHYHSRLPSWIYPTADLIFYVLLYASLALHLAYLLFS